MANQPIQAESAREQWQAAIAAFEMAKCDLEPAFETDEVTDFYVDAHFHALDVLMTTPAPDMAAFVQKLELFIAEECGQISTQWREPIHASLLADARRLAKGARHGRT